MIRKEIVSFKEGEELFSDDNGLHRFRDELSGCDGTVVDWIRFFALFWKREDTRWFPGRRKRTKTIGKLQSLLRIGASSGAQILRTIVEKPSWPLDLEV